MKSSSLQTRNIMSKLPILILILFHVVGSNVLANTVIEHHDNRKNHHLSSTVSDTTNTVNQIPLNDAISSNFPQIQGELPADRQVSIVLPSAQTKR